MKRKHRQHIVHKHLEKLRKYLKHQRRESLIIFFVLVLIALGALVLFVTHSIDHPQNAYVSCGTYASQTTCNGAQCGWFGGGNGYPAQCLDCGSLSLQTAVNCVQVQGCVWDTTTSPASCHFPVAPPPPPPPPACTFCASILGANGQPSGQKNLGESTLDQYGTCVTCQNFSSQTTADCHFAPLTGTSCSTSSLIKCFNDATIAYFTDGGYAQNSVACYTGVPSTPILWYCPNGTAVDANHICSSTGALPSCPLNHYTQAQLQIPSSMNGCNNAGVINYYCVAPKTPHLNGSSKYYCQ